MLIVGYSWHVVVGMALGVFHELQRQEGLKYDHVLLVMMAARLMIDVSRVASIVQEDVDFEWEAKNECEL